MKNATIFALCVLAILTFTAALSVHDSLIREEIRVDAKWNELEDSIRNRSNAMYSSLGKDNVEEAEKAKEYMDNATTVEELSRGDKLMCSIWQKEVSKRGLDASEVIEAGNRLAVARKDYNDTVMQYNKHLRQFPANLFKEFSPRYQYGVSSGTINRK